MKSPLLCLLALLLSLPVLAANPPDANAPLAEARAAMARGAWDDARSRLQRFTADATQAPAVRARAWNFLAAIDARQGKMGNAHDELRQALALDRGFGLAWENLGYVRLVLALQAYEEAALTKPSPQVDEKRSQLRALLGLHAGNAAQTEAGAVRPQAEAAADAHAHAPAPAASGDVADVGAALERWREAWQHGDAKTYLAAYAADFRPQDGTAATAWREQRTRRLAAAHAISITLEGLTLAPQAGSGHVLASFTEHLRAGSVRRTQRKEIEWRHDDDGWRIVRETAL
ncbi:MAG: hypothetical protein PHY45_01370 [Rhodocyclaceae bacterium]|nr:hypothetical protein [Rhodocyclaceae bacterium]